MDATPSIASIGALVGNPARASILTLLFDGRALTATELSHAANVAPATTSEHLGRLVDGGLLVREKHGRHRYYRLAGSHIAEALEPLFRLVPERRAPTRAIANPAKKLREARLCYDHLAGHLGVLIADALVEHRYLVPTGPDYTLTGNGEAFFSELGIDLCEVRSRRRLFARQCLDWSERRPHLAGALGASLTEAAFEKGWIKRTNQPRQIRVTDRGRADLVELLKLSI